MDKQEDDVQQLDLFTALVGHLPLRNERISMSLPFLHLAKTPRKEPIVYNKRGVYLKVSPVAGGSISNIWDWDYLLVIISIFNQRVEDGLEDGKRTVKIAITDLLKKAGRGTSTNDYNGCIASLKRLKQTQIETSIGAGKEADKDRMFFNWLEAVQLHRVQKAKNTKDTKRKHVSITIPEWLHSAVCTERRVLAIPPEYFKLTGGLERFIFNCARRHAGNQEFGWRMTFQELYERSGTTNSFKNFSFRLKKIIKKNELPNYVMFADKGQGKIDVVTFVPKTTTRRDKRFPTLKV